MTATKSQAERRLGRTPRYEVHVDYRFEVNRIQYTGSRVVGEPEINARFLEPLLQTYAAGTQHPVYYNPDDPGGYSLLKRGGNWILYLLAVPMLLIIGVGGAVFAYRQGQRLRSAPARSRKKGKKKRRPTVPPALQ